MYVKTELLFVQNIIHQRILVLVHGVCMILLAIKDDFAQATGMIRVCVNILNFACKAKHGLFDIFLTFLNAVELRLVHQILRCKDSYEDPPDYVELS